MYTVGAPRRMQGKRADVSADVDHHVRLPDVETRRGVIVLDEDVTHEILVARLPANPDTNAVGRRGLVPPTDLIAETIYRHGHAIGQTPFDKQGAQAARQPMPLGWRQGRTSPEYRLRRRVLRV